MIKWTSSRTEMEIEAKIARRAVAMAENAGITHYKQMTAIMDIDACHNNGCPLKLVELLNAPDGDFAHDIFGIASNINRATGKLENCFLPRYAA